MGKGLSPLQRTLLEIAAENRRNDTRGFGVRDAYNSEVLERYFGWRPFDDLKSRRQRFNVREIGEQRYRSAHASLTRAFNRSRR